MAEEDLRRELESARATIASQATQIHELQRREQAGSGVDVLRDLVQHSEIVGAIVGPAAYRALLDGIVQAARRLFNAGAASILILDHDTDELVFEAAGEADLIGVRMPSHKGIAGWVAMTGEPIAVGDVRRDPRWASDFAESTGYVPKSIMAAPLLVGEDVEGVIEVLDKTSAATFGLDDMDLLGLFARPAAIAVEQARTVAAIGTMLVRELGRGASERGDQGLAGAVQTALGAGSALSEQTLEMARLVHELSRRGERGRELAVEILSSVARLSS
jgi:GAF domain-containing protein